MLRALTLALALSLGAGWPAAADEVRDQQQWVLDALGAVEAWRTTRGDGVTVAVLDSGVDDRGPQLAGRVEEGPDFTGTATERGDPGWGVHGTAMASLIAGGEGEDGLIGVAPSARIMSVRVLPDREDPEYGSFRARASVLAEGIRYAADHGADVINMSLGGYGVRAKEREAVAYALDKGVSIVAATGNDANRAPAKAQGHAYWSFPAGYPGVIGVAAVDQRNRRAAFSNDNPAVSVAAPGVGLLTAAPEGRYAAGSGTSPASALVAGVVALIKARHPDLPPELVALALKRSTRARPLSGYNDEIGFGVVHAPGALKEAGKLASYVPAAAAPAHFGVSPEPPEVPGADPFKTSVYIIGGLFGMAVFIRSVAVLLRR